MELSNGPKLLVVVALSSLLLPMVAAQTGTGLAIVDDHTIQITKGDLDGSATVVEQIFYHNEGASAFDGTLTLDLDPDADFTGVFVTDAQGSAVGADQSFDRGPFANETVGAHVRYSIDLAAKGISIAPDETIGLQVVYGLPGTDRAFTRGFTMDTERISVVVSNPAGLVPTSDTHPLNAVGNTWTFTLSPEGDRAFAAGAAFSFQWEEVPVAKEPLGVRITASGTGPLTLTAQVTGGIAPYTTQWDLDGDGQCDDAGGTSAEFPVSDAGLHEATVCVTDSANPQGSVEQSYEARTIAGATVKTGPGAWLLGLVGLVLGALVAYGVVQGGMLGGGGRGGSAPASAAAVSLGAEARPLLEARQRVMMASLKELEIAKKKGEVESDVYTPLKAELKQDTVRVMRELERRKDETV